MNFLYLLQVQSFLSSYISCSKGNYAEAARLIREALNIVEAVYSPTHPRRATMLTDLGWQLISLGELQSSIEVAKQAIDILSQQKDPLWPDLGAAHNVAGDAYMSSGEYASARTHLEATLHAWRQVDNQSGISIALNNLGNLSNREGRFDLAEQNCQEALLLDQSRLRKNHPDIAYPLSCLGEASEIRARRLCIFAFIPDFYPNPSAKSTVVRFFIQAEFLWRSGGISRGLDFA